MQNFITKVVKIPPFSALILTPSAFGPRINFSIVQRELQPLIRPVLERVVIERHVGRAVNAASRQYGYGK